MAYMEVSDRFICYSGILIKKILPKEDWVWGSWRCFVPEGRRVQANLNVLLSGPRPSVLSAAKPCYVILTQTPNGVEEEGEESIKRPQRKGENLFKRI